MPGPPLTTSSDVPNSSVLRGPVTSRTAVVPREAVAHYGAQFSRNPVGTGAFLFEEWIENKSLTMVRNPNYYEETYPDEDDLPTSGMHPAPSLGAFVEASTVRAEVITLPYDVTREGGVKDGGGRFGVPEITLDPLVLPNGTFVRILYSSAEESIDEPGQPGEFSGPVSDVSELDGSEFLKIHIFLYSTSASFPGVDEIEIPVGFDEVVEP